MEITLNKQAREKLLRGADRLADTIRVTLGPYGRNVVMYQKQDRQGASLADAAGAGAPVFITNDGASIAESIVLADALENVGASILREAAGKTNNDAGDGTTTAVVLTQSLLHEVFRNEAAGADPVALRRGIEKAGQAAKKTLLAAAVPADDEGTLSLVAQVSCNEEELGSLIGHALYTVGVEGVVSIEDAKRLETELDVQEGIVLERGYLAPEMTTNEEKTKAELTDPYILLCDSKLEHIKELLPALIICAEAGRDCLVISEGLTGNARSSVIRTNMEGDIRIVCIEAPLYGDGRRWRMEDLAIQLGGTYFQKELDMDLKSVKETDLGTAKKVIISKQQTILSDPGGDPAKIDERIKELRFLAAHEEYEFNRKRHQERLANLLSGVAVLRIGGHTTTELWERKTRAEDAVNAARAAQTEGVVAGGGTALLRLIPAVLSCADGLFGDEKTGALSVARALEAPARQIAENAGQNGRYIVETLKTMPEDMGYDVKEERFCRMLDCGIIDPVRVTRTALESALSVAAMLLSTEAGVTGTKKAPGGR